MNTTASPSPVVPLQVQPLPGQRPAPSPVSASPAPDAPKSNGHAVKESDKQIAEMGHNSEAAGTMKYIQGAFAEIDKIEEQEGRLRKAKNEKKSEMKNRTGVSKRAISRVIRLRKLEKETRDAELQEERYLLSASEPQGELSLDGAERAPMPAHVAATITNNKNASTTFEKPQDDGAAPAGQNDPVTWDKTKKSKPAKKKR